MYLSCGPGALIDCSSGSSSVARTERSPHSALTASEGDKLPEKRHFTFPFTKHSKPWGERRRGKHQHNHQHPQPREALGLQAGPVPPASRSPELRITKSLFSRMGGQELVQPPRTERERSC